MFDNLFYDSADSLTAASVEAVNSYFKNILFNWTEESVASKPSGITTMLLSLVHNADGSLFKLYGNVRNDGSSQTTVSLSKITGSSSGMEAYGLKVGYVGAKPSKAYRLDSPLFHSRNADPCYATGIIVGTDGYAYICLSSSSTYTLAPQSCIYFPPCIYVNSDFGD